MTFRKIIVIVILSNNSQNVYYLFFCARLNWSNNISCYFKTDKIFEKAL